MAHRIAPDDCIRAVRGAIAYDRPAFGRQRLDDDGLNRSLDISLFVVGSGLEDVLFPRIAHCASTPLWCPSPMTQSMQARLLFTLKVAAVRLDFAARNSNE